MLEKKPTFVELLDRMKDMAARLKSIDGAKVTLKLGKPATDAVIAESSPIEDDEDNELERALFPSEILELAKVANGFTFKFAIPEGDGFPALTGTLCFPTLDALQSEKSDSGIDETGLSWDLFPDTGGWIPEARGGLAGPSGTGKDSGTSLARRRPHDPASTNFKAGCRDSRQTSTGWRWRERLAVLSDAKFPGLQRSNPTPC